MRQLLLRARAFCSSVGGIGGLVSWSLGCAEGELQVGGGLRETTPLKSEVGLITPFALRPIPTPAHMGRGDASGTPIGLAVPKDEDVAVERAGETRSGSRGNGYS